MKKLLILLVCVLLFIPVSQAQDFNPKKLSFIKANVIISGEIIPIEPSQDVRVKVYIPQNYSFLSVTPNNWKIVEDEYGNKMVEIFWEQLASREEYKIVITLESRAVSWDQLPKVKNVKIGQYKKLTENLLPTEEMKLIAFGDENVLEKTSRLTFWVYKFLKYDENYSGVSRSVKEIFESKKGVCNDYSLLLTSLLRFQEIPTRFVFGLAFNPETGFVPHSWIEILYKDRWVPFDPTWLEGINLDASHIKFASMPINNFTEIISYKGGRVKWIKKDPKVEVKEFEERDLFVCNFPKEVKMKGNSVYLLNVSCKGIGLKYLKLISCLDKEKKPVLQTFPTERFSLINGSSNFLFVVKSRNLNEKIGLICPLILTDNFGGSESINFQISENSNLQEILLEGPSSVIIGNEIKLHSPTDGILFSANDSTALRGDIFKLKPKVLGTHVYYFFSKNIFGKYQVEAVPKKAFEIIYVAKPSKVKVGEQFNISVALKNLESIYQNGVVYAKWDGRNKTLNLVFRPREVKNISLQLVFNSSGKKIVEVGIKDLYPNSYFFEIEAFKQTSLKENIFSFLSRIMNFLESFFKYVFSILL